MAMRPDDVRKMVAHACVDRYIKSGTVVGLGTGRTAKHLVERIAELYKSGQLVDIKAIPTSEQTRSLAIELGVPLVDLDDCPDGVVEVAVDGCDEVEEGTLNLVKGRGGALLREKMVASAAKKFIVVAEDCKIVSRGQLGTTGHFPVEIVNFASGHTQRRVLALPATPKNTTGGLRRTTEGATFVSDNGNAIMDLLPGGPIGDPHALAAELSAIVGVVEHGLFLDMATEALIGREDGTVLTLHKTTTTTTIN